MSSRPLSNESVVIIFVGDVHVKHRNVDDVSTLRNVVLATIDDARKRICPNVCVIIAGDLLDTHERVDVQLMNVAYDFVRSVRAFATTYVLVGNHDMINNRQFCTTEHWMNGMKEWRDVVVVDVPRVVTVADCRFVLAPYVQNGRFVESLDKSLGEYDWRNEPNCIFAHQEFKGCKMGAFESVDGDEWPLTYPLVISGHIHENQRPQPNVYYPGSALTHAYGHVDGASGSIHLLTFERFRTMYDNIATGWKLSNDESVRFDPDSSRRTITVHANELTKFVRENTPVKNARYKIVGSVADVSAVRKSREFKMLEKAANKVITRTQTNTDDSERMSDESNDDDDAMLSNDDGVVSNDECCRSKKASCVEKNRIKFAIASDRANVTFSNVLDETIRKRADADELLEDYIAIVLQK